MQHEVQIYQYNAEFEDPSTGEQVILTVSYTMNPLSDVYSWNYGGSDCILYLEESYTSEIEIEGDSPSQSFYGFDITHHGENNGTTTMRLAQNYILITNGETQKSFTYDIRDCQYYSPMDCCPQGGTFDITLGYNARFNQLWLYNGGDPPPGEPSYSNGWIRADNGSYSFWGLSGVEHCPLEGYDSPAAPTGFYISGNDGDFPTLHWNISPEPDVTGYYIYRSVDYSPFTLVRTIDNKYTNFWTDGSYIIGKPIQFYLCYKISAYDNFNCESETTPQKCVVAKGINKNAAYSNEPFDIKENFVNIYPNPFNPSTKINFGLKGNNMVKVSVLDLLGREIDVLLNEKLDVGEHTIVFNGENLSNGLYLLKFSVGEKTLVKKLLLIK